MSPEPASGPGSILSASWPEERRAPVAQLSLTKLKALVICLKEGGVLYKRSGVWTSSREGLGEHRIRGVTVADLSRDGLLSISVADKCSSARLTRRGSWFARTAASDLAAAIPQSTRASGRLAPAHRRERAIAERADRRPQCRSRFVWRVAEKP